MKEVIKAFMQIQSTSSLNEKKAIIAANQENGLFKKCLVFLLDDNNVTGISTRKIAKKVEPYYHLAPLFLSRRSTFEDVIDYLAENNTGTDADIYEVQAFLRGHEEDRVFYEQMITKKLKLGVDKKAVNEVIPELIPHWDVQLGSGFEKLKLKDGECFYLSQKLNGCRASIYDRKFLSRQGKEISGLQHIWTQICELTDGKEMFFDGELIRKNVDGILDNENFRIGTGIINSDAPVKREIKFVIF